MYLEATSHETILNLSSEAANLTYKILAKSMSESIYEWLLPINVLQFFTYNPFRQICHNFSP